MCDNNSRRFLGIDDTKERLEKYRDKLNREYDIRFKMMREGRFCDDMDRFSVEWENELERRAMEEDIEFDYLEYIEDIDYEIDEMMKILLYKFECSNDNEDCFTMIRKAKEDMYKEFGVSIKYLK